MQQVLLVLRMVYEKIIRNITLILLLMLMFCSDNKELIEYKIAKVLQ